MKLIPTLAIALVIIAVSAFDGSAQTEGNAPILPRPDFKYKGNVGRTIMESDPPQFPVPAKAPAGAPNIVLILIDDAGYGQFGTYGGAIETLALDRVAKSGLRYTRFHTTALCSPTRAAMLTGRNHHSVSNGVITEAATGYDGYTGMIPGSAGTIAQILRQYGYATAWFGKNHNTPDWETSVNGPFDRWPSGYGFDYFYGFMGGDCDQWHPTLYEDHTLVQSSSDPNYILTTDLTDHAITWLRRTRSIDQKKPFFLYMATGATHAPHHVTPEYIAKFKGKFDGGWDVYREETFNRQKQLGVIPKNTLLTPRPKELPSWESLSASQKKLFSRMMEVFAAFTSETDHEMGRLLDVVMSLPDADNTIIMYQVGDNGSSAEGGLVGLLNENSFFNGVPETLEDNLKHIDEIGGPKHFNHFPAGWAWAMNTPFQWTKQIASHLGGVRNPIVISWPKRIKDAGGVRSQFHHVIDLAPTIYEAVGITPPITMNGVTQAPIEGVSMVYSFDDAAAKERHRQQYFEMFINRGMYADGWWAASRVGIPWETGETKISPDDATWELYDLTNDYSQATDLAKSQPKKLRELQDLWWAEAAKYKVLPMDPRKIVRLSAEMQGRPTPTKGLTHFEYYEGAEAIPAGSAPNLLNKSWTITAQITGNKSKTEGAIFSMGGSDGGFGLYVIKGKPFYSMNFLGQKITRVESKKAIPSTASTIRAEFTYDGGGIGKGGMMSLFIDDEKVGETRVDRTHPISLGLGGTLDIGVDTGSVVDDETYSPPFRFNGKISKVTVDLKP
ncbi:MAG: arylsulfatase [Candidatus Kapabacteria bacterium]|nr:arylsulfatase [Candidatus Kapabacteria bacterium]